MVLCKTNSVHTIIDTDSIVVLGLLMVDSKLLLLEVIKQLLTQSMQSIYAKHEYLFKQLCKKKR